MKKLFCFITVVFLLLCYGCKATDSVRLPSDISSGNVSETESTVYHEESTDNSSDTSSQPQNSVSFQSPTSSEDTVDSSVPSSEVESSSEALPPSSDSSEEAPSDTPADTQINIPDTAADASYDVLSTLQKRIYDTIYPAANEMQEGWIEIGACGQNYKRDVLIAYRSLVHDNPDMFWLPTNYLVSSKNNNVSIAFSYHEDGYNYNYLTTKNARDDMQAQLEKAVDKIVAETATLQSDFEKELYVHDYLCKNVAYTLSGSDLIYTSYGALIEGKAVCEGYSRAMQLICKKLDIPCTLVYGEYDGTSHMWNAINIENNWYYLDVTWDDDETNNLALHTFFNVSEEKISKTHNISPSYIEGVNYTNDDSFNFKDFDFTSTDSNYFVKKDYYFTDDLSAVSKSFIAEKSAGNSHIQMVVNTEKDMQTQINLLQLLLIGRINITGFAVSEDIITIIW